MARDAKVLYQIQGHGVIHFAGQPEPAIAITAAMLTSLHRLARDIAIAVRDNDADGSIFRENVQNLHSELAMLSLSLTDTAANHDLKLKPNHRISGSRDFVDLSDDDVPSQ